MTTLLRYAACAGLLLSSLAFAQNTGSGSAPPPTPGQAGAIPSPNEKTAGGDTSPSSTSSSLAAREGQNTPPREPSIIEDGGFSFEPTYWMNNAQPTLRGGATATAYTNLNYVGEANNSFGGVISVPAGPQNTLRVSYFRVQGNSSSTFAQSATVFSEAYDTGDFVTQSYKIDSAKISWDYLSYTWYKPAGNIRLKTLYELQYTTVSTTVFAPYKAETEDSSGNIDANVAHGSRNLILPTLGLEFEQPLGKHFRWEVKGSGFGIPHRANIWDAEATLAYRVRSVEFIAGEKGYHFKDSPQGTEYFTDTLYGAYFGVRWYWGREF